MKRGSAYCRLWAGYSGLTICADRVCVSWSRLAFTQRKGSRVRYQRVGYLAAILLVAAACGDDTPKAGPVTIETEIDFSAEPFQGTFEVTEGADILGCSSGTFSDTPRADDIRKDLTCETGSNEGTFTAVFIPDPDTPGPGDENGPWSILESTGAFTGLQGGGDFSVVYADDAPTGVETLTGDIEYTS